MTRTIVSLKGVQLYAFHGVMSQERQVGNDYLVDVDVAYDFTAAFKSDHVNDTLNYADLYALVKQEMEIPSQLLEHVAGRIITQVQRQMPKASWLRLTIRKVTPPIVGQMQGAEITVETDL